MNTEPWTPQERAAIEQHAMLCDECYLDLKLCGEIKFSECRDCKRKGERKAAARALMDASGERIRHTTRVRFPDGAALGFLDCLPKHEALRKATG